MSAVVGASRVPLSAMAARFAKREAIGSFHPWLTSAHEVGCCKFATLRGLDPHARFRDGGPGMSGSPFANPRRGTVRTTTSTI